MIRNTDFRLKNPTSFLWKETNKITVKDLGVFDGRKEEGKEEGEKESKEKEEKVQIEPPGSKTSALFIVYF